MTKVQEIKQPVAFAATDTNEDLVLKTPLFISSQTEHLITTRVHLQKIFPLLEIGTSIAKGLSIVSTKQSTPNGLKNPKPAYWKDNE